MKAVVFAIGLVACAQRKIEPEPPRPAPASALAPAPAPAPAPVPAPAPACYANPEEAEVLVEERREITALVEEGTPAAVLQATKRMAALLEHPVFYTEEGRPAVKGPTDPRAFLDWWTRGGESWARFRSNGFRQGGVLSPPAMRSIIDPKAVSDKVLCARANCDPLASRFIDTVVSWGLKLEAYERGRFFARRDSMLFRCHKYNNAQAWLHCISSWRSVRAYLPIGDYRFPTSGWFIVRVGGLLTQECPTQLAMNLESGKLVSVKECEERVGDASVQRIREFALVALLAKVAEEIPQYQQYLAPKGMDLTGTCSLDSAPPKPRVRTSAHQRLYYWWWRDGSIVAQAALKPTALEEPASGLALKLLRAAEYTLVDGDAALPEGIRTDDELLEEVLTTFDTPTSRQPLLRPRPSRSRNHANQP